MNKLGIDFQEQEKVKIFIEDIDNGVVLKFDGMISDRSPETYLTPFFTSVHNKMIENKLKILKLDISNLSFLNSSGIKTFVLLITKAATAPKENGYNIIIKINLTYTWQDNSTTMLKLLAPNIVTLEKS